MHILLTSFPGIHRYPRCDGFHIIQRATETLVNGIDETTVKTFSKAYGRVIRASQSRLSRSNPGSDGATEKALNLKGAQLEVALSRHSSQRPKGRSIMRDRSSRPGLN